MASGYSHSDSVDLGTEGVQFSSNSLENAKPQRQRKVFSKKPQGSPKRPQPQASPGRRSLSQVIVAQATSQASSATKPQQSPAKKSQGTLNHSKSTLQTTGLLSPSLDSVFTTAADSSHFEPKKGKKTRVIQVKECVETIDNVHNEALVKPRTPFASPVNEARRRSVPRCVSFLNMADGARDVSTPAEARTSSARKSSKARSTSTPPNSACSSAKARAVSSPPTSARKSTATRPPSSVRSGAQSRTASKPPSSPGKRAKAQRSSYSRGSAKSRTASSPPSSAHMDIEIETSAPSRESSALSDYSDITILSNITILSAPRSQAPQAKTSSDIYSDDFEENTDEFGADSDSTLGQNKYESDFETDSDESIEDQSPPQKPEKKSHVPNAKPAEPSSVVFHANEKDDWRPKTSATYCIARTPDSENGDHAIGPRGKKQHWTRPHIQSPEILHLETPRKGTPGVGRNNVSPIMPTITMWNGYEADSEEDETCVVGRKANNKSDFEPVVLQTTPTRIETPEDSFFYELQDGSYESQFNKTPDFLQLTPPRKPFELPDASFLVDIVELTYEPTLKMGSESSRPATRMNLQTLRDSANDGRMQSAPNATTNEDVGNPGKCDDYDPTVDASGSESQRIMKTPTDEEFFDRPLVVEEPPSIQSGEVTPAYTNRNYDDMSAERKVLNMNGRGTPAPFSEERKELVKKLRPKSVTVIGKGLMTREEDIRIRNKTKITYSRNPEEEVKAEKVLRATDETTQALSSGNQEEKTGKDREVNEEVREKEVKPEEIRNKEEEETEKKEEVKEDVKEGEIKEEVIKTVSEKKEKKVGRMRRLFMRIRKTMTCCVKRQDDS